jgi:hypothetical protein
MENTVRGAPTAPSGPVASLVRTKVPAAPCARLRLPDRLNAAVWPCLDHANTTPGGAEHAGHPGSACPHTLHTRHPSQSMSEA